MPIELVDLGAGSSVAINVLGIEEDALDTLSGWQLAALAREALEVLAGRHADDSRVTGQIDQADWYLRRLRDYFD